jgi:hypothetical protein
MDKIIQRCETMNVPPISLVIYKVQTHLDIFIKVKEIINPTILNGKYGL